MTKVAEVLLIRPCKSDPAISLTRTASGGVLCHRDHRRPGAGQLVAQGNLNKAASSVIRVYVENNFETSTIASSEEATDAGLSDDLDVIKVATGNLPPWCYSSDSGNSPQQLVAMGNLSLGEDIHGHEAPRQFVAFNAVKVSSEHEMLHDMITIEGLRSLYSSCFSCGVNWHEDHVSLDCAECGGYAMSRPCPGCEGNCDSVWRRNLTSSHESNKAKWEGECYLRKRSNGTKSAGLFVVSQEQANSSSSSVGAPCLKSRNQSCPATSLVSTSLKVS